MYDKRERKSGNIIGRKVIGSGAQNSHKNKAFRKSVHIFLEMISDGTFAIENRIKFFYEQTFVLK